MGGGNTPPFLIYYMTFKEEIELQLVDNKTLSYEILSQLKHKNYYSGMSKKIGDTVLFGMLKEESENGDLSLNFMTFNPSYLLCLLVSPSQTILPISCSYLNFIYFLFLISFNYFFIFII